MNMSSTLFARITTYSNALRYLEGDEDHGPAYQEVIQLLDPKKATVHKKTNLSLAAVEYVRLGFVGCNTSVHKIRIAMYIAVLKAGGQDNDGLAKEVCDRFRGLDDFDRGAMTQIFNLSICNDRTRLLLDNAMVLKTKNIHLAIKHEFQVEFVSFFFDVMERIVCRGQPLTNLEYVENTTPSQMEGGRGIIEKHPSSIATKFGLCFDLKTFKKPRAQNNLFPARGAFPQVSIGCELVNFDEATVDTLKASLSETKEKYEFLETMYAAMVHSSNDPGVTYRALKLQTVQDFYLETILDRAQKEQALGSIPETSKEVGLREELQTSRDTVSRLGEKLLKQAKEISHCREVIRDLEEQLERKRKLLNEFNIGNQFVAKKSRKPINMDKHWLMRQRSDEEEQEEWSGDEDE